MPLRPRSSRIKRVPANDQISRAEARARSASPPLIRGASTEVGATTRLDSAAKRGKKVDESQGSDENNIIIATPGSSFRTDITANSFDNSFHRPHHPELGVGFLAKQADNHQDARTTEDLALDLFGDSINLDSSLCRKLAGELAIRVPIQRRPEQKLNMERRSNVEAVLAHMSGQTSLHPCKNCHKGHGPWKECIVLEGLMCGSCANCWFNASGARCTFHENNNPLHHSFFGHPPPYPVMPNMMGHQQTPVALPSIAGPTPSFHQPSPGPLSMPYLTSEITNWGLTESTTGLISQSFGHAAHLSRNERYLARIETAAKELGMRIAEYDEYLATPEGISEQQRSQGQIHHRIGGSIPNATFDEEEGHHGNSFTG